MIHRHYIYNAVFTKFKSSITQYFATRREKNNDTGCFSLESIPSYIEKHHGTLQNTMVILLWVITRKTHSFCHPKPKNNYFLQYDKQTVKNNVPVPSQLRNFSSTT